jgi:hypothetical protein
MRFLKHFALGWAVAMMGTGIWYAYHAWLLKSQQDGMLGVLLMLCAPMLATAVMLWRCSDRANQGAAAEGALVSAIDCTDAALRMVRFCRAFLGVAGSYVFVLWFCQLAGYMRLMQFLVFYSVVFAVAAAVCMPWLASSEGRLHDDRAWYRQRLWELEASREEPASTAAIRSNENHPDTHTRE